MAEIKPAVEKTILDDPRIQKALRRLKSMGLVAYAYLRDNNHAVILIDELSIVNYIIKRLQEATPYQNKKIYYDRENKVIKMEVWKGE